MYNKHAVLFNKDFVSGTQDKDIMTAKKINILFGTQEYYIQAGGVGAVTVDLPPALVKHGYDVSVVTPFFDAYNDFYKNKHIEHITSLQHIYNEKQVTSDVFRVCTNIIDGQPIYHYLIKPEKNSPVGWLFNIENNGANIYQSFEWSEKGNRIKYFNGAVAAMLRLPDPKIPEFDIYHSHAWHTSLSGVIAKEMDTLPKWKNIINSYKQPAKKAPYMISAIHALRDTGQISSKNSVRKLLISTGLPADFTKNFPRWKALINEESLKQAALGLLYSDHVTAVSEGLAREIAHPKSHEQSLEHLFAWLQSEHRLEGILNGIDHAKFDGTSKKNLHDLALNPDSVTASKRKIKEYLQKKYPQLDPDKMWFNFIGRFAIEKGVDMLPHALETITKEDGIFIVMGRHIVKPTVENGKIVHRYGPLLDELRKHPNVLVIDDPQEQNAVGAYIRAASDCVIMPSHDEPCGLPQIEGFANGAFAVASNVQGLPESVKDFADHPNFATGFLYNNDPHTRQANLKEAIHRAAQFYREQNQANTLDSYLKQLLIHSKQFDWNASSATKYSEMYNKVLQRPMLRLDQIRTVPKPLLSSLDTTKVLEKNYGPRQPLTPAKHVAAMPPVKPVCKNNGKIFVIGFNKCGTETLQHGFADNGIPSAHYGPAKKPYADVVYENFKANRPLLTGIDKFKVYSDIEDVYYPERPLYPFIELFMLLDRQYPGSTFILNTRDKDKWIKSRMLHRDPISSLSYADILSARYQINKEELVVRWSKEWDDHHSAVRAYFKDRPNDFIEYNLETSTPQDLSDFFPALNLDPLKFKHLNKTKSSTESAISPAISSAH